MVINLNICISVGRYNW